MRVLVLNGPNLGRLGRRQPEIYGHTTHAELTELCVGWGTELGLEVEVRQTNHEGELIDWVQEARDSARALIINPAGYGHTSIALLDALKTLDIPIVECHLSNPAAREGFRRRSYVALAATGVVSGFGAASYELAVEAACDLTAAPRA